MPTATGSTVSDGLIAHQQQMLDAIQRNTSGTITKAFSEMIAAVMPSAARFRSAYAKELQRVQDEAEDDSQTPHVSLYWLVSSGMLKELVDAINDNMEKAAKETAPAIAQGQQQAQAAGQISATAMSAQAAGVAVSKVQQPTQPTQPDEGTDETIDGLPSDTSGNAKKAIMAGVLAGLGGQALMQGVQTVLTGALQSMLGLGESSAAQAMQQGASLLISSNSGLLDGWIWSAESGACIACLEMDGSFHTWDEDMESHLNCGCVQQPWTGPQSAQDDTVGRGEDWFNAQDDAVQAEILGPSKYLAWKNGDIQLMDLVSKEGGFIHERSLKDLGLDFRDYLQQLPTKRELLQLPDISLLGPHDMTATLTKEEETLLEEAQLAYAAEVPKLPEINVPAEAEVSPEVKALQDQRATLATQRDAVQSKLDTLSEKWRAAVLDQAKFDPEDDAEEWAAAEKKIQAIEKQQATQMKKLDSLNGKMAKVDAKIQKAMPVAQMAEPLEPAVPTPHITALPSVASYTLPEIDQEAEDKLVQQIQDVLGTDTGVAGHTDAIELGKPIQNYLDDRLGPLADYGKEANSFRGIDPSTYTGDQIAWLTGDPAAIADHGGMTVQEAMDQYNAALRQETIRLLDEARGVGVTDLEFADGAPDLLADTLRQVQEAFPTDWLDASNEDGQLTLLEEDRRRGYYRSATTNGNGFIGIRATEASSPDELYTAMAHELGHRMEDSVDGVWQMERDFYNARTAEDKLTSLAKSFNVLGMTKTDKWASGYIGKEAIRIVRGGGLPAIEHYELLSTGLEWVLGTDPAGAYWLAQDEEFHQFILGILFGKKVVGG